MVILMVATTNTLLESSSFVEQITKVVSWSLVHWDRLKLRIGTCRRLTRLLYSKELRVIIRVIYFPTNLGRDLEPQNLPNHRVYWRYHPWKLAIDDSWKITQFSIRRYTSSNISNGSLSIAMLVYRSVSDIEKNMLFNKMHQSLHQLLADRKRLPPPQQNASNAAKNRGGERQLFSFTRVSPLQFATEKITTVEWSGPVVCRCM